MVTAEHDDPKVISAAANATWLDFDVTAALKIDDTVPITLASFASDTVALRQLGELWRVGFRDRPCRKQGNARCLTGGEYSYLIEESEQPFPRLTASSPGREDGSGLNGGRMGVRFAVDRLLGRPEQSVVVVVGQAGIGKTTLINEVAASSRGQGVRIVRASAEETGDAQFQLWRRPAHELGVELPELDPSVGQPEQIWELTDLLSDSLVAIAPVVLVADDLHWADASSLAVLRHLSAELVGRDAVVLAATRESGQADLDEVLRGSAVVRLEPMTQHETAALAEQLLGHAIDADRSEALHRRSGGVPLLIDEVLRGGVTPGSAAIDVLHDTLRRAGDDALDTLSALAVGGADLPINVLAAACAVPVPTARRHLDSALDADVLTLEAGSVGFRHDLLAEAAARRLDGDRRRAINAALAAAWSLDGDVHRRAHHLVDALPSHAVIDDVVDACLEASDALRRARRSADAVKLLTRATAACIGAGAPATARARLAVSLGESHWEAGDLGAAIDTFTDGASLGVDDVELATTLEVARHRLHTHHLPDPDGRATLRRLDSEFDPSDSPLRARLLGRLGALAQQPPFDAQLAESATLRAVEIARRLDDPESLAQALHDRYLWPTSIDHLRQRDAHADELITVARRAGRPDLALVGLQWRLDAEVNRHDVAAARRTVDESAVLVDLSRSSEWRLRVLVQRALLSGLVGDRHRAFDLIGRIDEAVDSVLPPLRSLDKSAYVLFVRNALCRLYGAVDPDLGELFDREEWVERAHNIAVQSLAASIELAAGRPEAARSRVEPWLADPQRFIESATPLLTLCQLARFAVLFERADAAGRILDHLRPFRGRLVLAEQVELVDLLLAGLCRLVGEAEQAISHAHDGLAAASALGSLPFEARCRAELGRAQRAIGDVAAARITRTEAEAVAGRIGVVLDDSPPSGPPDRPGPPLPPDASVTLLRRGRSYVISHRGRSFDVRATAGLEQLCSLIAEPRRERAATELAGYADADAPPVQRDVGPALDAQAKREYRRRLLELQAEMDDSDRAADPERSGRAHAEYSALLDELRRATGIGGRDRPQHSGDERARVNVTRNIRRAIDAIASHSDELGRHLQVSVRTGRWCCYEPDPTAPIRWTLRT